MTNALKILGNCQCCGRTQAVVRDRMSKHGYTVEAGWFNGVCSGDGFAPMQIDRAQTDSIVATVREQVKGLRLRAFRLENGHEVPEMVKDPARHSLRRGETHPMVAFDSLPDYHKHSVLASIVWNMRGRADAGEGFANGLAKVADTVHGQALTFAERPTPAAPIMSGERRAIREGMVATVLYTNGARVYWKTTEGRKGWTGSQAWRKLPMA